jgi:hypothetical protein
LGHAFFIVEPMTTTLNQTPANQQKLALVKAAFAEILTEALRRGFHGTVAIELCVQDGTIQHVRRRVERIEK